MVASAVIGSLALRDSSLRCVAEAIAVFGDLYDGAGGILYGGEPIFVGGVAYRLRRARGTLSDHSATTPPSSSARSKFVVKPPPFAR